MGVLTGTEKSVDIHLQVNNEDRTLGATLSHEISKYEKCKLYITMHYLFDSYFFSV